MVDGIQKLRSKAEELMVLDRPAELDSLNEDELRTLMHELHVHKIELEIQNEELRSAQTSIAASRDKYTNLYNISPVGYCTLNDIGIILECNETFCKMLGQPKSRIIKYPFARYVYKKDLPILTHLLRSTEESAEHEISIVNDRSEQIHTLFKMQKVSPSREIDNLTWLVVISDVTDLHNVTMELMVKGRAIETTMEGVMITNSNVEICYVNQAFEETTGYSKEEVLGKNPSLLQSGKHTRTFYSDMWNTLKNKGKWRGEIWNRRASGDVYPEHLSISTVYDEVMNPLYYVSVFSDVTREEEVRNRLQQLAYYDGITGLPNRHLLLDRMQQELIHAKRNGTSFSVLFMDLDHFKSINDTLGHAAGDQLLIKVGDRLKSLLREIDTIARMGGDEFLILLPNVDTHEQISQVANKILSSMYQPYDLDGHSYHISISIGVSCYPRDGHDVQSLIKHGDIAMYKAKESGRNAFVIYSEEINNNLKCKISLEHDLRDAINHDQFYLHYQPQFCLKTGRLSGVEALIRWHHPVNGEIQPVDFIGLAEESGLIVNIGYWVLRTAAKQYRIWKEEGLDVGIITINLSPHQFLQSKLLSHISSVLEETGMPTNKLGIEITESAAMPNFEYSVGVLKSLRAMGVTIYIDDFGTGFSSLSYLRQLPIDVLKIDRQFIADIPNNPDDVAIVQAIMAMANNLNLQIVGEGVETQAQLDFLKTNNCQVVQGYLMSKPVSAAEISAQYGSNPETTLEQLVALAAD
ncbi:MAG: EAL domain-containing protein [Sedimenticola sp.]|nr:EAL domain-containing protein [Sedimenticola sp.]